MSGFEVAVVIPLFNKAPFIRATLSSVLAQSHPAEEIIIVDDGSTDSSVEAIADLIDGPVRLIRQPNAGPGPARNCGIAEAGAEWIAFVDGDDRWAPDHLATLAAIAGTFPDCAVLATGFSQHQAGDLVEECQPRTPAGPAARFDPLTDRRGLTPLWTGAVAVRRQVLQLLGGFAAFVPGEDQELWLRLALHHRIALSPRRTAFYFRGTGGLMDGIEAAADRRPSAFHQTLADFGCLPPTDPRQASAARFRDRQARAGIKLLTYQGHYAAARHLRALHQTGNLGVWRFIVTLPRPLLAAAVGVARKICRKRRSLNSNY